MATIPEAIYGRRQAPQDRTQFVSQPGQSRTAAALAGLGEQLGRVGEEYQRQNDIAAVSAARQKLDEWERSAIFDPEKGAINKRGINAEGVPDELQKGFDQLAGEVSSGLSGQRQREAFSQVVASRRGQILDWGSKHALKERESYQEGQYQADIQAFQERAALFPDKAPVELSMMGQRIIGYMRDRGRSTEEINAALRDGADKAHVGVVAALLDSDDDAAATKYFDANKDRMSPEVRARVGGEIKQRGNLLAAQRNADALVSSGLGEKDALEKTRKEFQGRGEEAAVQELRTRYAEAETMRIRRVKEVSNAAWSSLMDKGSMSAIPAQTMAELRATAPEEERQMRDWLMNRADAARAREKATFEPDDQAYIGLRRMARDEPQKFLDTDLRRLSHKFSDGQINALLTVQDGISRKDAREMESNRVVGETLRALDAQIRDAGLSRTAKPDSKQAAEYAKFQAAVTEAIDSENDMRRDSGKPPLKDEEARAIGLGMLRHGIEQGSGVFGFGQTTKRGYEIAAERAHGVEKSYIAARFSDIPEVIRNDLVGELRLRASESSQSLGSASRFGSRVGSDLTTDQQREVENAYQRGIERGVFK